MPLKINREALDALPASAKQEVEAALAGIFDATQANPLVGFWPEGKQTDLLAASTDLMAAFAGNRFGKTCLGAVKNIIDALDESDVPEHLKPYKKWQPPFFCRILAPDFTDYIDAVILPEIRKWVPEHALLGGKWDKAYSDGRRTLRFRNGSEFRFFSYKQDKSQLGGSSVHRVWFDEPPPETHRNECLARLIQFGGDELFTMTPLHGVSWLEKEVWKNRHLPGITVVKGSGYDNPVVSKKSLDRIIAKYPEDERQARLYGDFVHFSGRIFKEFTEADHVVDAIDPKDLANHEVVIGIDPGWDHGFAVTFNAFDAQGCCLTFDEMNLRGATVERVVSEMRQKLGYWNVEPSYYVIDGKGGKQTSVITGYNTRKEFARYGISCRYAKNTPNSWGPSVNRMKTMLAATDDSGNPAPRLKVTRNCNFLVDGYLSYHYKYDADDRSMEDKAPRPYKKDDDTLDATRYVVMSRTWQDPFFYSQDEEEEPLDLHTVAGMNYHLDQIEQREYALGY